MKRLDATGLYPVMKSLLVLSLGLLAARAEADTCDRWSSHLNPCDGVVAQSVCAYPDLWTPNQWIAYKNWLYSSTPADACRKYWAKHDPDSDTKIKKVDDTYYDCYSDWDDDGDVDDDDWTGGRTYVLLETVVKDECCSRVPKATAPYSKLGATVRHPGSEFSYEDRKKIITTNRGLSTFVTSDARLAGVSDPGTTIIGLPVTNATYRDVDDPEFAPKLLPILQPDGAHVDHIIPRIDSNGCPCGSGAFANAAVISAELNTSMGRSCLDPRRQAFLATFTDPAHVARETSEGDACGPDGCEPSDAELEAAGCTATPGDAGLAMLALGGLVAVGRRRRK